MKKRKEKVKELFEKYVDKVYKIKNLKGGLSNDLFLINGKYVWRIFMNSLIDHKNEIIAMEKLDYFSIYHKDQKNICYKFIKGNNIDKASYKIRLKEVFKEVRKIHKLKIKTPHIWHGLIPKWLHKIQKKDIKNMLALEFDKINKKLSKLHVKEDNVFCHNDLIPGNVLFKDKKCFIIDWEFAGVNYYFFELGNMICENHIDYDKQEYNFDLINKKLIKKVIKYYDNADGISAENKIKKLKMGIRMSHLFWTIYSFAKLEKTKDDKFDYLKYAKSRINQLVK